MKLKIKKITYLFDPRERDQDFFNNSLDVFVDLDDDFSTDGGGYFVKVTTPQFLSTMMEKENCTFLKPDWPRIIVSKLTDDIIKDAIESFANDDEGY